MALNPYASFLGSRDPIAVLESTYGQIARLTAELPGEQFALRKPEGKWTAREIVCHLADCELVFLFRLKQTLAMESPTIQPFNQDRWAERYGNTDFDSALRLFSASRDWTLLLIAGTSEAERGREMTHPERGTMSFWTVVETMAGHDVNHLEQLQKIADGQR